MIRTDYKLFLMLIIFSLLGCGESLFKSEEQPPDSAVTTEHTPTITIGKLSSERVGEHPISGEKITWILHADLAPRNDTLVLVSIPTSNNQSTDQWVIIPKFKPTSERFTDTIYEGAIEIIPLPMTVIAGEGETVDTINLKQNTPDKTRTGVKIPNDFIFPLYTVGNPSQILCDDCNAAALPTPEQPPTNNNPLPESLPINQPATISPPPPEPPIEMPIQPTPQLTQPQNTTAPTDTTPPTLISGTITNGSINVNHALINQAGKLEFTFNEPITGQGKITDAFGTNLLWRTAIRANTLTLHQGTGGNLVGGLTYTIELNVQDAFRNSSLLGIIFVTTIK